MKNIFIGSFNGLDINSLKHNQIALIMRNNKHFKLYFGKDIYQRIHISKNINIKYYINHKFDNKKYAIYFSEIISAIDYIISNIFSIYIDNSISSVLSITINNNFIERSKSYNSINIKSRRNSIIMPRYKSII